MREVAWRIFAGEYSEANHIIHGKEEKAPKYVITPMGAKVNRLFVVGVLTDVENIGKEGIRWRARIADPTGIHNVYAEPFNPEVASLLADMEAPSYVAVAGKVRIYEPEEGSVYLSMRAEEVKSVDAFLRDYWIVQAARNLKMRIDAMKEAKSMSTPSIRQLRELGYPLKVAEGVLEAMRYYKDIDIEHYEFLLREALSYISIEKKESSKEVKEAEEKLLAIIKELQGEEGAEWDAVIEQASKEGIERSIAEEAIANLMEDGIIYEPELGKLKMV